MTKKKEQEGGREEGREGGREGGQGGRTLGAPSTSSLASLRPRPLMVRTWIWREGGRKGGREEKEN